MKGGGYRSPQEVICEALRVHELVEQADNSPQLTAALRHSLRSPLKKYQLGHFAALAMALLPACKPGFYCVGFWP